jgi:hypothetical protein
MALAPFRAVAGSLSTQPPHRPDRTHDVIKGPTPRHRIGLPHQRLEVIGPADFLMLEQVPTVAR